MRPFLNLNINRTVINNNYSTPPTEPKVAWLIVVIVGAVIAWGIITGNMEPALTFISTVASAAKL